MAIKTNCFQNIDGLIEVKFEKEAKWSIGPAEAWKFINIFSSHVFMNQNGKVMGRTGHAREAEETCVMCEWERKVWRSMTVVRTVALRMISINSIFPSPPQPKIFSTEFKIKFSFCDLIAGLMGESFLKQKVDKRGFFSSATGVMPLPDGEMIKARVVHFSWKEFHARYLPSFFLSPDILWSHSVLTGVFVSKGHHRKERLCFNLCNEERSVAKLKRLRKHRQPKRNYYSFLPWNFFFRL